MSKISLEYDLKHPQNIGRRHTDNKRSRPNLSTQPAERLFQWTYSIIFVGIMAILDGKWWACTCMQYVISRPSEARDVLQTISLLTDWLSAPFLPNHQDMINPKPLEQAADILREFSPPIMCHMSLVTCTVSSVTCHVSSVIFFLFFFLTNWWS